MELCGVPWHEDLDPSIELDLIKRKVKSSLGPLGQPPLGANQRQCECLSGCGGLLSCEQCYSKP